MYLKNISFSDLILNYLSNLQPSKNKENYRKFLCYRRTYRNYINVMLSILRKKYPIDAVIRNGTHIVLHNIMEAQIVGGRHIYGGRHEGIEYDITNDIVTLSTLPFGRKGTITIYGGISNGDIISVYVDNIYQRLPVQNKTVVDIGGNIGDSAIYFALIGASKIICVEPFPKNYELAQKNIKLNNYSNIITAILAGCSHNRRTINIDPSYNSGILGTLKNFDVGIKVPLLTLEDILNDYHLQSDGSIILKMDCEGCEYETLLSADDTTLQKFSHMMIEYHYGYKNLKEKLEMVGFKVSVTRPKLQWSPQLSDQKFNLAVGHIFAVRY
jgi:FkbM family methyltransferase